MYVYWYYTYWSSCAHLHVLKNIFPPFHHSMLYVSPALNRKTHLGSKGCCKIECSSILVPNSNHTKSRYSTGQQKYKLPVNKMSRDLSLSVAVLVYIATSPFITVCISVIYRSISSLSHAALWEPDQSKRPQGTYQGHPRTVNVVAMICTFYPMKSQNISGD